jgi:hypothetical protein
MPLFRGAKGDFGASVANSCVWLRLTNFGKSILLFRGAKGYSAVDLARLGGGCSLWRRQLSAGPGIDWRDR